MMEKIAVRYDREVDQGTKAMIAIMEPLIIVVLGIGVGFIVIAMFLPILKMSQLAS